MHCAVKEKLHRAVICSIFMFLVNFCRPLFLLMKHIPTAWCCPAVLLADLLCSSDCCFHQQHCKSTVTSFLSAGTSVMARCSEPADVCRITYVHTEAFFLSWLSSSFNLYDHTYINVSRTAPHARLGSDWTRPDRTANLWLSANRHWITKHFCRTIMPNYWSMGEM